MFLVFSGNAVVVIHLQPLFRLSQMVFTIHCVSFFFICNRFLSKWILQVQPFLKCASLLKQNNYVLFLKVVTKVIKRRRKGLLYRFQVINDLLYADVKVLNIIVVAQDVHHILISFISTHGCSLQHFCSQSCITCVVQTISDFIYRGLV
jgi:hypothetical protein